MELLDRIRSHPGGPWIAAVLAFGVFGGVYRIFDFVEKIPNAFLRVLLLAVMGPDASKLHVELTPVSRAVVAALYFGAVLTLCVAIFLSARWLQHIRSRIERRLSQPFQKQAWEVYSWLKSRDDLPFLESKVNRAVTIRRNLDVDYVERATIKPDGTSLYAVAYEFSSDERLGSHRCEFNVRSRTPGTSIICIPAEEGQNRHRAVALLVPPLSVGHTGIDVEVTARWPRAARKLEKEGVPDTSSYFVKKRIQKPIDEVVFSITVEAEGDYSFRHEVDALDCKECKTAAATPKHFEVRAYNLKPRGDISIRVTKARKAAPALVGD